MILTAYLFTTFFILTEHKKNFVTIYTIFH